MAIGKQYTQEDIDAAKEIMKIEREKYHYKLSGLNRGWGVVWQDWIPVWVAALLLGLILRIVLI